MNIRSVGPVLYLASQAATKDGRLDFVCVREEDRSIFMSISTRAWREGESSSHCPFAGFAS